MRSGGQTIGTQTWVGTHTCIGKHTCIGATWPPHLRASPTCVVPPSRTTWCVALPFSDPATRIKLTSNGCRAHPIKAPQLVCRLKLRYSGHCATWAASYSNNTCLLQPLIHKHVLQHVFVYKWLVPRSPALPGPALVGFPPEQGFHCRAPPPRLDYF